MTASSCGDEVGELAGGGTGGMGMSTGPITGFGSVVLNNAHYSTDDEVGPGFKTKKIIKGMDESNAKDRDILRVGMIVTLYHSSQATTLRKSITRPISRDPSRRKTPVPR